jgi:hypothetical protein
VAPVIGDFSTATMARGKIEQLAANGEVSAGWVGLGVAAPS